MSPFLYIRFLFSLEIKEENAMGDSEDSGNTFSFEILNVRFPSRRMKVSF